MPDASTQSAAERFIQRWAESGGSERANYQLFLAELCDFLEVPRPDPARPDNLENAYVFERSLRFVNGDGQQTTNFIDLYKRGCFICETKQGVEHVGGEDLLSTVGEQARKYLKQGHGKRGTAGWDRVMKKARGQGERYIRSLPATEGRPPFLLVVDVGHVIEVYSEFTRTGGHYTPFPDTRSHRIKLTDLSDGAIRERLRAIWTDPDSLDRPGQFGPGADQRRRNARYRHQAGQAGSLAGVRWPRPRIGLRFSDALRVHHVQRGCRAAARAQLY